MAGWVMGQNCHISVSPIVTRYFKIVIRFAAALIDLPLWVMNVVPVSGPDTLPVIFDRGLIGIYHDWCESLNTYPRSYDLLHSSFLFGNLTQRYNL